MHVPVAMNAALNHEPLANIVRRILTPSADSYTEKLLGVSKSEITTLSIVATCS
jgi:hypothetical protein